MASVLPTSVGMTYKAYLLDNKKTMLAEHDLVALRADLPEHSLQRGDMGIVVSVHPAAHAYTVEFMTLGAETLALPTLAEAQVRLVAPGEIAQARPHASTA